MRQNLIFNSLLNYISSNVSVGFLVFQTNSSTSGNPFDPSIGVVLSAMVTLIITLNQHF